jgi:hypothetical protein
MNKKEVKLSIFSHATAVALSSFLFSTSFAQQMSAPPAAVDNQCRVQAKEIAIQTYQTCVSETRAAKVEQIRKEYQEKIIELKKQYESEIQELKAMSASSHQPNKVEPKEEVKSAPAFPKTTLDETPEANNQIPTTSETVQTEELSLQPIESLAPAIQEPTMPTIVLKPAAPTFVKKNFKKARPVIAQNRAQGEKGVKGIAKSLPSKKRIVKTKPASQIITEAEKTKTAPIQLSELEKVQLTQAPLSELNETTGEVERLQSSDQNLSGAQVDMPHVQ